MAICYNGYAGLTDLEVQGNSQFGYASGLCMLKGLGAAIRGH